MNATATTIKIIIIIIIIISGLLKLGRLISLLQGLIQELVEFNLHEGTTQMRSDVRHLLCLLTKDNNDATEELNRILIAAVAEAVSSHKSNPSMVG